MIFLLSNNRIFMTSMNFHLKHLGRLIVEFVFMCCGVLVCVHTYIQVCKFCVFTHTNVHIH
jgi:hypothetical protein